MGSIGSFISDGKLGGSSAKVEKFDATPLRDPYAPNYELVIYSGVKATPIGNVSDEVKQFISEITYEDNSEQFDSLKIKFASQIDTGDVKTVNSLMDSKLFTEGHVLQLLMGYGQQLQSIGACSLAKFKPNYPSDGPVTLEIEGFDILHRASRKRPRGGVSYKGFRDSQIASIIGARNGFDISKQDPRSFANIQRAPIFVDPKTGITGRTQKAGVSDYEFLKKVADTNGFDLFSRFNPEQRKFMLFFQPPARGKQREVLNFIYNEGDIPYVNTLLSFSPTMDAHSQASDFEIFIIDQKTRKGLTFQPNKRFLTKEQTQLAETKERRIGSKPLSKKPILTEGVQIGFKAFGQSFRFPPYKRFVSEAQIRKEIEEFVRKQRENFITGKGLLVGNEFIQSRQVHGLLGLGEQFSGNYYFYSVKQKMGKNKPYTTEFTCRKVIDDLVVQSGPTATINESDKRVLKFDKFIKGK